MHYATVMCVLALALMSNVHSKPADSKLLKRAFLNFLRSLDSETDKRHSYNEETGEFESSGDDNDDEYPTYPTYEDYGDEVATSEESSGDNASGDDIGDGKRTEDSDALEQEKRDYGVMGDANNSPKCIDLPKGSNLPCIMDYKREESDTLEQEKKGSDAVERSENEELEERAVCADNYGFCSSVYTSGSCSSWANDNCKKTCGQCLTGTKHDAGCCKPNQITQCEMCEDYTGIKQREESDTLEQEQRGAEEVERSETEELLRELKELLEEEETRNTQEERAVCSDTYYACRRSYCSFMASSCRKTCEVCTTTGGGGGGPSTNTGPTNVQCGVAPKYSSGNSQYIVGGSEASKNRYPWQVRLNSCYNRMCSGCGGSIINKNWILTAGHCVEDDGKIYHPSMITVTVGGHRIEEARVRPETGKVDHAVAQVIIHDYYRPQTNRGAVQQDIALLKLAKPIQWSDTVRPVCLPTSDISGSGSSSCTITGWGRMFTGARNGASVLQYANVPLLPSSQCIGWGSDFTDGHVCAGIAGSKSTCQGDSGGPLVCGNPSVLEGVVSFGTSPCEKIPPVFVKVYAYRKWIKDNTNGEIPQYSNPSY